MLGVLPDWFDLDALRLTIGTVVVLLVVGLIVALALIRSVAKKLVAVVLIAGAAAGVLYYRSTLDECEETCSCEFVFDQIEIDGCLQTDAGDE